MANPASGWICSLVEAYLARRAAGLSVGFNRPPVLWRNCPGAKVGGARAIGYPLCGLIVEREMEIEASRNREILEREGPGRHAKRRQEFQARS